MILQGTTDHTGRFTHIDVGWSGRNHNAHVFRNSSLFEAMDAGLFCPSNEVWRIGDVVPPFIVADGAYPLRKWLMKPYGGNLEPPQAHFNYCLSHARNVVERAFGRLKSRWRCLSSRLEVAEENVPSVITERESTCFPFQAHQPSHLLQLSSQGNPRGQQMSQCFRLSFGWRLLFTQCVAWKGESPY
ncbi:uncharacterized protein LOC134392483 [Elgaria multicarinata webbii]|uniref:uncharacterized protein LOC134392483 n=1 Tax=Elgaria multicarinata webbii TaxID=159646 RepID=UPI002FCD3F14